MSGDNHVFAMWSEDLLTESVKLDIESMRDRLLKDFDAQDAVDAINSLLLTIECAKNNIELHMSNLANILHAVEWMQCGDSGPKEVKDAIKKWRNAKSINGRGR